MSMLLKFMLDEKLIRDGTAETMMQPQRFKILKLLKDRGPMFVDQISKEIAIHPRLALHHVNVLQEQRLIESNYELTKTSSKRDIAVRMCRLTTKGDDAMNGMRE